MFDRIKRVIAVWNDRTEIMSLTERDLEELEVTRADLLYLASLPDSVTDRMAAMAAIFGVKAEDLQFPRSDFVAMLHRCDHCGALTECRHALGNSSTKPADCGFCPNAEAFAAA